MMCIARVKIGPCLGPAIRHGLKVWNGHRKRPTLIKPPTQQRPQPSVKSSASVPVVFRLTNPSSSSRSYRRKNPFRPPFYYFPRETERKDEKGVMSPVRVHEIKNSYRTSKSLCSRNSTQKSNHSRGASTH
ncbi:hypothetical protein B296_00042144 [Ensete ventricosum]|uniref:Uncharacterized protein n=1 Tax=Ensete ventricosum TaxID=4639 RepID=A0A426XFG5_ENSVE|nr:hypothetical protein B296_00042144 [Ensete ventricosum]